MAVSKFGEVYNHNHGEQDLIFNVEYYLEHTYDVLLEDNGIL